MRSGVADRYGSFRKYSDAGARSMDMRHLLMLGVIAGCTPPPPEAARQGFDVVPQLCTYTLQEPVLLAGNLPSYDGAAGFDCVPPEGGEAFTVGFAWPGGLLRLVAPRPVAGVVLLHDVGLYVRTETGWCTDWDGTAVIEELPAWAVAIDGTCVGGGVRVEGQISGLAW
jgi:hypothetical protein